MARWILTCNPIDLTKNWKMAKKERGKSKKNQNLLSFRKIAKLLPASDKVFSIIRFQAKFINVWLIRWELHTVNAETHSSECIKSAIPSWLQPNPGGWLYDFLYDFM